MIITGVVLIIVTLYDDDVMTCNQLFRLEYAQQTTSFTAVIKI